MKLICSGSAFKGSLEDTLATISAAGFTHVDLIAIPGWNQLQPGALAERPEEEAERTARLLEAGGLTPVSVNCAVPALYRRDAEAMEQRTRELRGIAAFMQRLGIRLATFYPGYKLTGLTRSEEVSATAATLREMADLAGASGLVFALEPHYDTPFQSLAQIGELIDAVPDLAIAYDPSHFAAQGIAIEETAPLFARTVHVHLRDAAEGTIQAPPGQGRVPFEWLLGALRGSGYDGFCSLELLPEDDADPVSRILTLRGICEKHL